MNVTMCKNDLWVLKYQASLAAQTVKNLPAMQETWIQSLGQDLLEKEWQPMPVFLLGEFHGQRSLAATVHGVTKSRT